MKSSDYIRDPAKVYASIKRTSNGQIIAVNTVKLHIPVRYTEYDLASFENETTFLAMCAIIVDDKYYGVIKIPGKFRSTPSLINEVKVDDVEYIEMTYLPGSVIINTTKIVKVDSLVYNIFNELVAKARLPWYFDYNDALTIFNDSNHYSGVNMGANIVIMHLIMAACCRSPVDVKMYYRQWITSYEQIKSNPPYIVPLRAVSYGATNVTAKLMGSHFDENLTSSLVSPGRRVERTEMLIRA